MAVQVDEFQADDALKRETKELRRDLLPAFLVLIPLGAFVWTFIVTYILQLASASPLPLLLVLAFTVAIWQLRKRFYYLASWGTLIGMILIVWMLTTTHLIPLAPAFAVVPIIAASVLLGDGEALLTALLAWAVVPAFYYLGWDPAGTAGWHLSNLFFCLLAWAATWMASRPFAQSMQMTLQGWMEARNALQEVRLRRAEIYRTLRSLEEATYRIERLNNELILAQRDAEEARASKARFVAMVSHELRGPLNLILGFSRMIVLCPEQYDEPLPSAYRADIDAIYRNSLHLSELVNDVLDLSQIDAGRLPLVKDRVEIERDVIRSVVDTVAPLAERKGLFLREEIESGLPWILADPVRLRQALLNLLTNALRFTETGGITIQARRTDSRLELSVKDTGPGIAAENLPNLFKEFSQLSRDRGDDSKGSGLGLSICKQLVELHGGELWATSAPGQGTTFHMSLPLLGVDTSPQTTAKKSHHADPHDICLIVHEDVRIAQTLGRLLWDYRVVSTPVAQEVPLLVDELRPKAVIVGSALTEEVASVLAQLPYDVPLISSQIPSAVGDGQMARLFGYLLKPINSEMVFDILTRLDRSGQLTALVVDDEPDAVALLERVLRASGSIQTVLRAYDGEEALGILSETIPDVAFIDLLMPELGGEKLLARMQADEHLRQVPVVIVSAKDPLEEELTIGGPIYVDYKGRIEATRWAKCITAVLQQLRPCYLHAPTELPASRPEHPS